jgi:DNA mismatch repair protein MutL
MARIHILPVETSRLIAAGEVIDRPASALRELIDNAIDSGASDISVEIEKGGIELIRVSDSGSGMSKDDLSLSILEHATSKIENADDLLLARTLGFRGEALASIAAVARLEMTSREPGSESAWRLRKETGREPSLDPVAARAGTTVTVRGIFERFPARRQFLKRPPSEALLCRQVFVERALAHPSIAFSWGSGADNEHFPAASLEERVALLYREIPRSILSRFEIEAGGAAFTAVYADPSFHRKDRKYLQVFVNRRKVPEWGFLGILEYAFSDYLPGGMKPCAFLFIEIDPSQADFNIHPAKREVRIKNPEPLKSGFYAGFKTHLHSTLGMGPTDMSAGEAREMSFPGFYPQPTAMDPPGGGWAAAPWREPSTEKEDDISPSFRYLGRAFGPFLVFERGEELFILDQHAAHERILYDAMAAGRAVSQPLLVPFVFEGESEGEEDRLKKAFPELERMGYRIEASDSSFIVNGVPSFLGEKGMQALVDAFREGAMEDNPARSIVAGIACHAAIKDGELLDESAARELIQKSLALPFPRCPHGRPIWVKLDRTMLYRMVGRITA